MINKFPQSRQLKELIESLGWCLYDSTVLKGRNTAFSWEELQERGVAEEFIIGHDYTFAPIPQKNETLREAYSHTEGIGPCIQLDNRAEHINMDGDGAHIVDKKITYIFTRLAAEPYKNRNSIGLFTPPGAIPNMPFLVIPFEYVLEKFKKHFKIITPEEYFGGLQFPCIQKNMN